MIKSILSAKETLQTKWQEVTLAISSESILFHLNPSYSISTPKVNSHYNCYMLLGYDILISEDLHAHLIGESVVVGHWLLFLDSSFFFQKSTACLLSLHNQTLLMREYFLIHP